MIKIHEPGYSDNRKKRMEVRERYSGHFNNGYIFFKD